MEFFRQTSIPFMRQRHLAAVFSLIIFLLSMVSLFYNGLNLGLDFTGGTQVQVSYQHPAQVNPIRKSLRRAGFSQAVVVAYNRHTLSIRVAPQEKISHDVLKQKLLTALPGATLGSLQYIGPQVGKQLVTSGILAIVVAFLLTFTYIALRFEMRFAFSAILALIHDPVLILGIFSFFHLQFDMITLTAVLTVIGYSLNDTIVVYDRVRENFHRVRKQSASYIMDLSINQTLSRTIMTSGLTLLVVIALFIYGGEMIHGFALALIIGIVVGTYSSIYVAGSLAIAFGLSHHNLVKTKSKMVDDTP